jgi:hypothetical protein
MGASGSFEAWYDSANVPTLTTGLYVQPAQAENITLTLGDTATAVTFKARIEDVEYMNSAKGLITFNGSFVSTGTITFPT